jgi:hypothetical protein
MQMMSYIGDRYVNAGVFVENLKHRRWRFAGWAMLVSVLFTDVYIELHGNLLIPLGAICAFILIVLAWQFPKSMYFVMLIGACAIETFPMRFTDSSTDLIPLFWDVNTIVQVYLKLNFHGFALSFFELLLITSGVAWFVRGVYYHTLRFKAGTLFLPIALYVACVFIGLMNGLATGGQFNIALFEVRAQVYFLFAYLMAVNSGKDSESQVATLLWCSAIAIGFKGVLCSARFIFTLKGVTIPEIGIGSHEESFFFNCFIFELLVLKLANIQPKLRRTMLFMLPTVILANLANERRAATAALVIALILLLVLAAVSFPKRRIAIAITAVIIAVVTSVYLPLFWNGSGTIAQPARAIKSQFSPDPRDASSNEYRDAENTNLMYTMRFSPIIGYGYGKPIREQVEMVDLSSIDPFVHFMTHNQILWVWMRVGTVGFYFFWMMITGIIIQGCQLLRNPGTTQQAKAAAMLGVLIIVMELVFGLLDLQLSNVRNMLYCGLWAGQISVLTTTYRNSPARVVETALRHRVGQTYTRWNLPDPEQIPS